MRIICISDLHGNLPRITNCDLLIVAGDICPVWNHDLHFQRNWLDSDFKWWLQETKNRAKNIIGIAGNHDLIFERQPESIPDSLDWIYLQDSSVQYEGLRIWGSPWQLYYFGWAFNLYEPDLKKKWESIPDDIDILVVHGPPHGYGDLTPDGRRTGSQSLLERISALKKLKLVVTGHIHDSYGVYNLRIDDRVIPIANSSLLNEQYELENEPLVFELAGDSVRGV